MNSSKAFYGFRNLFNQEEINKISEKADNLQKEAQKLYNQGARGLIDHRNTQFVISETTRNDISIDRIVWAAGAEPELLTWGRDIRITVPVGQLLNIDSADHLINQIHYKLPGDEVNSGWHQDIQNRKRFDQEWQDLNKTGSFVQVITAIDPMTQENSPLEVFPGIPKNKYISLDQCKNNEERELIIRQNIGEISSHALLLEPGDTLFMNPYVIHGSKPNCSNVSRRIFINGFSYPEANHKPYPGVGSAKRIRL